MISKKNIINHLKWDKFELILFISVQWKNIILQMILFRRSKKYEAWFSQIIVVLKSTMSIYMVQRML
jgi:hypothetical protein